MARYGSFRYGGGATGAKYGTSPTTDLLLWSFIVDWDGDGYYSGENEAERMVDFTLNRGRDHLIEPSGQGFQRYRPGEVTVVLDNSDGRYDAFNVSSPLYPNCTPGKYVRVGVKNGSAGTSYGLMRGKISDIQPYNDGLLRQAVITVIDGLQFLEDRTVRLGYQNNIPPLISPDYMWTSGRWLDLILERADWPEDEWPRTYDLLEDYLGQSTPGYTEDYYTQLLYAWFWQRNATEAIRELEDVEVGTFVHDNEGNARFFSKRFTHDTLTTIDQSEILRDISTPQPWETLRNRIEVNVHPIKAYTPNEVLWSLEAATYVGPESAITIDIIFRYGVFQPVGWDLTYSLTANSLANGTGTNLSANFRLQLSEIGDGMTLIILNDGVTGGYVTALTVTGDVIYAPYRLVTNAEDTAQQAIYGTRTFSLESPWMQDATIGQEVADFLLEALKTPQPYPIIKIEQRPALQYGLDLYADAVNLVADAASINRLYRIGKIEHKWLRCNGQAVVTTYRLEAYFALDAPVEVNYDLFNDFDTAAESDCTGPAGAGMMEWCFDPAGEDANYPDSYWAWAGAGAEKRIYLFASLAGTTPADAGTALEYVIPPRSVFSYYYQWGDTDMYAADEDICHLKIATLMLGDVYDEPIPFVQVAGTGEWTQQVIDLSPWEGETIAQITFSKVIPFVSTDGDTVLRIDRVGLGTQIYP